jgi:hypothetical protein
LEIVMRSAIALPLPHRQPEFGLDPLIKEARDRQRRRRRRWLLVALVVLFASGMTYGRLRPGGGSNPPGLLSSKAIGSLQFGASKADVVAALEARFGQPTWAGINTGCSSRYSEVVWSDLAVEFRADRFSGYRYLAGGYPGRGTPQERESKPITPKLAIGGGRGATLGSTLGQVRTAYGPLRRTGADWWQTANGLSFEDGALRDPVPSSSRIIEIKIGTCGDF